MEERRWFNNLRSKIAVFILVGAVIFSALIIFVTSYYLDRTLTESLINQGKIVGRSIAELAAVRIIEEDRSGLKKIIEDFRSQVARGLLANEYILILDDQNNIIADTYNGNIPEELKKMSDNNDLAEELNQIQQIQVGDEELYDIQIPIKEGLLGFVRVGLKKSFVDSRVNSTLFYIAFIIALGTLAALISALIIITVQVTRPVTQLANAAQEISLGNFNTSVKINVQNELQILAAAIDRMRESLKTSLEKLKTRSTIGRF
ncbi:MAG: HAMP domain-containing protein [Calditrichaeota bacterium]|nr:MAG: HAMP domain-containing protein [Calditrichota bacterium]